MMVAEVEIFSLKCPKHVHKFMPIELICFLRFMYSFSHDFAAFIFKLTSVRTGNRFVLNIGTFEVTIREIIGSSKTLFSTFGDTALNSEVLDFSEMLVPVYQIAERHIVENRNIK